MPARQKWHTRYGVFGIIQARADRRGTPLSVPDDPTVFDPIRCARMGFFCFLGREEGRGPAAASARTPQQDRPMLNRIERWMDEEEVPDDYWIVSSEVGNFAVSAAEAGSVISALSASDAKSWVQFEDLFGACRRLRAKRIDGVWESTAEQRRRERRFTSERRSEAKRDQRPWDEE